MVTVVDHSTMLTWIDDMEQERRKLNINMAIGISIISMLYSYKTAHTQKRPYILSFGPCASVALCLFVRGNRSHVHTESTRLARGVGMTVITASLRCLPFRLLWIIELGDW